MGKKYDSFIELTPGYESVVDINSDKNSGEFWSKYIVNDDMVNAVRLLSLSLRPDDPNEDVWHFFMKGSYGTGKTYSAIVIKHLLQDDYSIVEKFLNKNKLFTDVKDKFLAARKKGPYYVKFRSGECKQLNTSNKLLFQLEQSVREILKENNFTYTGRNSLINTVKEKVNVFRLTLKEAYDQGKYNEYWSIYASFDDFSKAVNDGDVDACSAAQEILESMNIGLATNFDAFKSWLKDVFEGNEQLSKTGIFIIWDEFTEYIRSNDLDIIQQLSLLSKEVNFFIMYVLHAFPGLFAENVSKGISKADARFHEIEISLSEKTTLKLIGESIVAKPGMGEVWEEICDELYSSIKKNVSAFIGDPSADIDAEALKSIFPVHPMTVNMVSKVAGIAASNRSIFEFLKSSGDDGFRAYIHDNGQDDWKWVTIDYLWDYFFVNNLGGKKDLSKIAEDALKHYAKTCSSINDERVLRVYKGAMLLLATIGSRQVLKKSKGARGIQATEKTLCDCFCGIIDADSVKTYLNILSSDPLNLLVLAPDTHEGARIELPYSSNTDELEMEIEKLKKEQSPLKVFSIDGAFGNILKKQFVPDEKAVVKRLVSDACYGTTQQINSKFYALKDNIIRTKHKFGLLIVVVPENGDIDKIKATTKSLLDQDESKRILVSIMAQKISDDTLNTWYELVANGTLAQKSGNRVNANAYATQAGDVVSTWVSAAISKDMWLMYGETPVHAYGNKNVISEYEKIVFTVFEAAPERIIKKITLYRNAAKGPAYFGVTRTTLENKSSTNPSQKHLTNNGKIVLIFLINRMKIYGSAIQ